MMLRLLRRRDWLWLLLWMLLMAILLSCCARTPAGGDVLYGVYTETYARADGGGRLELDYTAFAAGRFWRAEPGRTDRGTFTVPRTLSVVLQGDAATRDSVVSLWIRPTWRGRWNADGSVLVLDDGTEWRLDDWR